MLHGYLRPVLICKAFEENTLPTFIPWTTFSNVLEYFLIYLFTEITTFMIGYCDWFIYFRSERLKQLWCVNNNYCSVTPFSLSFLPELRVESWLSRSCEACWSSRYYSFWCSGDFQTWWRNARLTAVWQDSGSNHTAAGCLYRDSCCDIQPWARAAHFYCSA